jgi:hypothetical protein
MLTSVHIFHFKKNYTVHTDIKPFFQGLFKDFSRAIQQLMLSREQVNMLTAPNDLGTWVMCKLGVIIICGWLFTNSFVDAKMPRQ